MENVNASEFIRKCPTCGNDLYYSTKGNMIFAEVKKRTCKSCGRTRANTDLWKDEDYRKTMSKVRTEGWKKYWEVPGNKEKLSKSVSARNKERWKDEAYRNFMYEKIKLNSIRGVFGSYKGHHFRSSLELFYMVEILDKQNLEWRSCENDEFCIQYEYNSEKHWYYPDFKVGNKIIEIKPKHMWENPIVLAKALAAREWCKTNGFEYEMIDPGHYNKNEVINMHKTGVIELQSRKLLEFFNLLS